MYFNKHKKRNWKLKNLWRTTWRRASIWFAGIRKKSLEINQGFKKRWGSQYGSTENSFPFKSSSISSATYFPAPADRINLKKYFQFSLDIGRVNSENYSFLIIIRVYSGIFLCDSYLQIDNSRKKWNIYWRFSSWNSRIWKKSLGFKGTK